jgi:hypothetical protein
MSHDNDAKQDEIRDKKPKLEWLDSAAVVAISSGCLIAFLLGFGVSEVTRSWQLEYRAKMRGTDAVVLSEKGHEPNNARDRYSRNDDDAEKQESAQLELGIGDKNAARRDDDSVGSDRRVPKNVRAGEFSVLMPPLLVGAPQEFVSGWAIIFVRVSHGDSKPKSTGRLAN